MSHPAERATSSPGPDAVTLLSAYAVLLYAVPSRLVIGPLGGIGTPASMLIAVGAVWWLWHHVHRLTRGAPADAGRPVRAAAIAFAACVGLSYVVAMTRPIEIDEISGADTGLIVVGLWVATVLLVADGVPSRPRMDVLVHRLTLAGGALAILGIIQFVTGAILVDQISIPGLSANSRFSSYGRALFTRPPGTSVHPIEYGAVLTMLLPLALYSCLTPRSGRRGWVGVALRCWPAAAIVVVVPLSLSRSALLGTALGLAILLPGWPVRVRRIAGVLASGLSVVLFLVVPGLMSTLLGLFSGVGSDTSAGSRLAGFDNAMAMVERSPVLGRGFGTFLPKYQILDNQALLLLVEVGALGLAVFVAVGAAAMVLGARAVRRSTEPSTSQLGRAVTASVAVGMTSFFLFDGFSFPMASGTLALVIGLAGALDRLESGAYRGRKAGGLLSSGGRDGR